MEIENIAYRENQALEIVQIVYREQALEIVNTDFREHQALEIVHTIYREH